jgi:hypothetical protein
MTLGLIYNYFLLAHGGYNGGSHRVITVLYVCGEKKACFKGTVSRDLPLISRIISVILCNTKLTNL